MSDTTRPPPAGDDDTLDLWQSRLEAPSSAPVAREPDGGARYVDRGPLGAGGMGEIRRVWDRRLGREVVWKLLHSPLLGWARFANEARLTARLEHPAIVPVHDFGISDDGRPWFAMKRIEGQTFQAVIAAVHRGDGGWTLRRAAAALLRACEAVAFAHSHGVIHRDIKPDNIMVGAFGQVYMMDWGIAQIPWGREAQDALDDIGAHFGGTRAGAVMGTRGFMPPEQAEGDTELHGTASDVYALGAVLWTLLTGAPPPDGFDPGDPPARPDPEPLLALCLAAMARDPRDRPPDAAAFAQRLSDWRDGVLRREAAQVHLDAARALLPDISRLRAAAATHREAAAAHRDGLEAWSPVSEKQAAWAEEDAAEACTRRAELAEVDLITRLQAAISDDPSLDDAHQLLADRYRILCAQALQRRDRAAALRHEALLRRHDRGRHRRWLSGQGAVSFRSDPPGAAVAIARFTLRDRRLVPVDTGIRAHAPVARLRLPAGSYQATLTAPGRTPTRHLFVVPRGGHADGTRPGDDAPFPVWLPPQGALAPGEVYLPAGWALLGNPTAHNGQPQRKVWVDAVIMRQHPVTNREYLAFLNELVAQGRAEEALRWAPREQGRYTSSPEAVVYHRDARGRFFLGPDSTGDTWLADWPVILIGWQAASAWCAWAAKRDGKPWRLPWEVEREKAGGGDGRCFPWGDHREPTWSHNRSSQPGRPVPAPVGTPAADASPYGVAGLAGNVRDWCLDVYPDEVSSSGGLWPSPPPPPPSVDGGWRRYAGGAWNTALHLGQLGTRMAAPEDFRGAAIGFRPCYSALSER